MLLVLIFVLIKNYTIINNVVKCKVHPSIGHEGAKWGWVVNATPRPLYPRQKTQYPLYKRLGGPQDSSGWVRKISPPLEFDPRTVQPVGS